MFGISATLAQAIGMSRLILGWSSFLIAVIGGLYFYWRKAKEEHFELMDAFDGVLLSGFFGLLSARLGYIFLNFGQFKWDVVKWLSLGGYPGLWWMLGLFVAFLYMYRWADKNKQDVWEVWDFFTLFLAWYFTWYWISRFFFGVAAGKPTDMPWGMIFPQRVEPAHPVQLYAAFLYGGLFSYLWWVEPQYRFFLWYRSKKRTAKTGYLFAFFCILTGFIGFILSFVQYPFWLIWDIDSNQLLSVALLLAGGVILYIRSGRTFFLMKSKDRGGIHDPLNR